MICPNCLEGVIQNKDEIPCCVFCGEVLKEEKRKEAPVSYWSLEQSPRAHSHFDRKEDDYERE